MKVVTVEEMRQIEAAAIAQGISAAVLMESAGRACAEEVLRRVDVKATKFVVLVGPGNNGGDGLAAAHYLAGAGGQVTVMLLAPRPENDPNLVRLKRAEPRVTIVDVIGGDLAPLDLALRSADIVVDAVLGTGRARPLEGVFAKLCERTEGKYVVAVDLPTGLDADTGRFDMNTIQANLTLALGFPKVGEVIWPGAGWVGELVVLDIGLPEDAAARVSDSLISREDVALDLPPRPRDAHKGTFGRLLIVGGCAQYYGAPMIAAAAALRSGVGLAQVAAPASIVPMLAMKLTEATFLPLPEDVPGFIGPAAVDALLDACARADAVVLGCGTGLNPTTRQAVRQFIREMPKGVPLLVDADALTILAETPNWWVEKPDEVILTPHAGEMGRFMGSDAATVQGNRLGVAREAAQKWGVTVVLKGAGTIVADLGGSVTISPVATPALATAGTGDCLAGVIGALLAQAHEQTWGRIVSVSGIASLGVYLHGEAGLLAEREIGPSGALAGDIVERLPRVFQALRLAARN